jgi:NAD(P)H-flavin reductase
VHENGERIPLTIKASDPQRGTITLVVQAVGKTTAMMNELGAGDSLLDVVGPLGKPSEIEPYGHCVVIGGGVGTAIALPIARALHDAGNRVTDVAARKRCPRAPRKCTTRRTKGSISECSRTRWRCSATSAAP